MTFLTWIVIACVVVLTIVTLVLIFTASNVSFRVSPVQDCDSDNLPPCWHARSECVALPRVKNPKPPSNPGGTPYKNFDSEGDLNCLHCQMAVDNINPDYTAGCRPY